MKRIYNIFKYILLLCLWQLIFIKCRAHNNLIPKNNYLLYFVKTLPEVIEMPPITNDSTDLLLTNYDDSISFGSFLMQTLLTSKKDNLYQKYHTKLQDFYHKYQLPIDILFIGRKMSFEKQKLSFEFQPLTHNFNINPVEGIKTNCKLILTKEVKENTQFGIELDNRYGFNSGTLASHLKFLFVTRNPNFKRFEFGIGTQVIQFNNQNPVAENINSLYYLLDNYNYLKIYYQRFIKTAYKFELKNGLKIQTGLHYELRQPLSNLASFPIIGYTSRILPNYPTEIIDQQFTEHKAVIFNVQLSWQIKSGYETINSGQYPVDNKLPILIFNFTQGIPKLFQSTVNFNKWDIQAIHNQDFNKFGALNLHLILGGFINKNTVEIMDYNHYFTNQFIINAYKLASFQALPIYLFSNKNDFYLTSFNQYQFKNLFNYKSIKNWNMNLTLNANLLYINSSKYYHEYKIGLERLFKYFTFEFVYGLDQNQTNYTGIRLLSNFF